MVADFIFYVSSHDIDVDDNYDDDNHGEDVNDDDDDGDDDNEDGQSKWEGRRGMSGDTFSW